MESGGGGSGKHQGSLAREEKKGTRREEKACENESRFLEGHLLR